MPQLPFDPARHAQKLVLNATAKGMLRKTREIVGIITPALNSAVEQFFQTLAPLMGQEADLASQLPIPGLAPWHSLSLPYIKHKMSAAFFAYSAIKQYRAVGSPTAPKRGRTAFDVLSGKSTPLIAQLRRLSGKQVFGGVNVKIKDWRGVPVEPTTLVPLVLTPQQLRFTIIVRAWGDLTGADRPNIERYLEKKGVFTPLEVSKLTNPRGLQRPLIRPWLSFYSNVILPDVIQAALETEYSGVNVRVARQFDAGPF